MLLPMYLCHYMQESVHWKDPATSTYGHTCPKDDFTYQIILQSLFITKNYKLKTISKIVINI
jgi:hypothetical protein